MGETNVDVMDDYLKALDDAHNPQGVEDGYSSYPDANYQVRLDKLYFGVSKSEKKRKQCVFEFDIISGEYAGRKIFKFSGMETASQLDFLTRDLRNLGISTFKWSEVQKQFATVLDKLYIIELKTKKTLLGEMQNIYIKKKLNSDDVMISDRLKNGSGAEQKKDKVPF